MPTEFLVLKTVSILNLYPDLWNLSDSPLMYGTVMVKICWSHICHLEVQHWETPTFST